MAISAPEQTRAGHGVVPADALALLSGVAVALGHGVEADAFLAELAGGVRRLLDADRVSVLLLDGDRLTPAIAVARQHDDELWQRFRRMPPIPLRELPGATEALRAGAVVFIDDASKHPLIPEFWQRQFGLSSLAIAPLHVRDEPAGALVIERRASLFDLRQRTLLDGLAALAGVALSGVRDSAATRRIDRLADALRDVTTARSPRTIAEHTLAALLDVAGLAQGLFALYHGDEVEVVAVRGAGLPEPGRYLLALVPDDVVTTCRRAWKVDAREFVQASVGGNPLTFVPVSSGNTVLGIAVLPTLEPLPKRARKELGLIAETAGTALRTMDVDSERSWLRRALALTGGGGHDLDAVVADVLTLVNEDGPRAVDIVVADRALARITGLAAARPAVARQITAWRRSMADAKPTELDGVVAVPLASGDRVFGALLVHPSVDAERVVIATRLLTDAIERRVERHRVDLLARATAEAEAHRSVAVRCYTETGQVLGRLGEQLKRATGVDRRTTATARTLADHAGRLVRDAATALDPQASRQPTLRAALAAVAEQTYAHGGPQVTVRQIGRLPSLEPATQIALTHAARRVLNYLRSERAVLALLYVEAVNDDIAVHVRTDDVLGLDAVGDGGGLHATLRDARAWLSPVGGQLEHSLGSDVWRFVMTAPAGLRRPERLTPVRRHEDNGEVVPLQSARTRQP